MRDSLGMGAAEHLNSLARRAGDGDHDETRQTFGLNQRVAVASCSSAGAITHALKSL